jgi:hypothetical protein
MEVVAWLGLGFLGDLLRGMILACNGNTFAFAYMSYLVL